MYKRQVIVQTGNSKINVTIEYYDDTTQDPKTMIYASKKELSPGESIKMCIRDRYEILRSSTGYFLAEDGNYSGAVEQIVEELATDQVRKEFWETLRCV